ncbi:MAG: calcium-binding protein, partial [Cyanobacteria bacterium J06598_1]
LSYNIPGKYASTLMPYDIGALRQLYGARNFNGGKTTYKFTSVYSFDDGKRTWGDQRSASKLTLVDDGGYDELDFSQLAANAAGYTLDARVGGAFTATQAIDSVSYEPVDRTVSNLPLETTTDYGTRLSFESKIESIVGSQSDDVIVAGEKTRQISAGGGDDKIFGRERESEIWGGLGSDQIVSGDGRDELHGGSDFAGAADGDDEIYGGGGSDTLWGDGGDDVLRGQLQNDTLLGGQGNDWLFGSETLSKSGEKDKLSGGEGRDWFVLGTEEGTFYQGSGYATITDWEAGKDRLQLGLDLAQYTLDFKKMSGGSALDTGIYLEKDLIAVIEDSTEVTLGGRDTVFV